MRLIFFLYFSMAYEVASLRFVKHYIKSFGNGGRYAYATAAFGPCAQFQQALNLAQNLMEVQSKYDLHVLVSEDFSESKCMENILGYTSETQLKMEYRVVLFKIPQQLSLECFGKYMRVPQTPAPQFNLLDKSTGTQSEKLIKAKVTQAELLAEMGPIRDSWTYAVNKLWAFSMTGFDKVIYVDNDIVFQHNADTVFEEYANAKGIVTQFDHGESPGHVCSGMMIFTPKEDMVDHMTGFMKTYYENQPHGCKAFKDIKTDDAPYDKKVTGTDLRKDTGSVSSSVGEQHGLRDCGCWNGDQMVLSDFFSTNAWTGGHTHFRGGVVTEPHFAGENELAVHCNHWFRNEKWPVCKNIKT